MTKNNNDIWNRPAKERKTEKKPPVKRETIEEFLARGGKIQRVAPGAGRVTLAEIEQEDFDEALADFCTTVKLK